MFLALGLRGGSASVTANPATACPAEAIVALAGPATPCKAPGRAVLGPEKPYDIIYFVDDGLGDGAGPLDL